MSLSKDQFYPIWDEYGTMDGKQITNPEPPPQVSKDTPLYHGTAGKIEGGIVRPSLYPLFSDGAYATTVLKDAERYATEKPPMWGQGRLFGTVYEVEPVSNKATVVYKNNSPGFQSEQIADPEGMRVKRIVSFPPTYDFSEDV